MGQNGAVPFVRMFKLFKPLQLSGVFIIFLNSPVCHAHSEWPNFFCASSNCFYIINQVNSHVHSNWPLRNILKVRIATVRGHVILYPLKLRTFFVKYWAIFYLDKLLHYVSGLQMADCDPFPDRRLKFYPQRVYKILNKPLIYESGFYKWESKLSYSQILKLYNV